MTPSFAVKGLLYPLKKGRLLFNTAPGLESIHKIDKSVYTAAANLK